jgi:hypothetical protein
MLLKLSHWLGTHWLTIMAMCAIGGALYNPSLPFAYFQLMNWAVLGATLLIALNARNTAAMWLFIIIAVIFNPIAPLFFRADIWQIVDIVAIFCLFVSFFIEREPA